jgi:hypothetical protein
MNSELEIIDALIDGQRVDADAIKHVLADPEGRAYLVDAWLLREAIQEAALHEGEPRASHATAQPAARSATPGRRWLVAAAIVGSLLGGYATGRITGQPASLTVTAPATTAVAQPSPAFPVPAATRVIQLEFHTATTTGGD